MDAGTIVENGSKEEADFKMSTKLAEDSAKIPNGFGSDVGTNKRPHPPIPLTAADKQDSAMDLNDFGPSLEQQQSRNYKTIQQILVRMNRLCVQPAFGTPCKLSIFLLGPEGGCRFWGGSRPENS